MNAHDLKALQVRATRIRSELGQLEADEREIHKKLKAARLELQQIEQKLLDANFKEETIVTEHAMLRFIERAMGIDLQWVQEQILNEQNRKVIKMAKGNCRIKAAEGLDFVVKDNRVVSVVA